MTTHAIPSETFTPQFQTANPAQHATHELQTWPACFAAVLADTKPFDVRENDRHYQVGDLLLLREYDPDAARYTGRTATRWVSYVLPGGTFGVEPNWSVLGFSKLPPLPAGLTDVRIWQ